MCYRFYGFGKFSDGRPYYAMRFIRGKSLAEAVKELHGLTGRPFESELRKLLQRFVSICETIEYAHKNGILHRDLKPGNVMLGEHGETLVLDWGLAKPVGAADSESDHPASAERGSWFFRSDNCGWNALGSPSYMSPEQARGEHASLGPATDVFSLGATLFSMLTNERPVLGDTPDEMLDNVRSGEFRLVRGVREDVPHELAANCNKAMAAAPSHRYRSAKALADDVEHFLADEAVKARPDSMIQAASRVLRRYRVASLLGVASLAIVALISTAAAWFNHQKTQQIKSLGEYGLQTIKSSRQPQTTLPSCWSTPTQTWVRCPSIKANACSHWQKAFQA